MSEIKIGDIDITPLYNFSNTAAVPFDFPHETAFTVTNDKSGLYSCPFLNYKYKLNKDVNTSYPGIIPNSKVESSTIPYGLFGDGVEKPLFEENNSLISLTKDSGVMNIYAWCYSNPSKNFFIVLLDVYMGMGAQSSGTQWLIANNFKINNKTITYTAQAQAAFGAIGSFVFSSDGTVYLKRDTDTTLALYAGDHIRTSFMLYVD